MSAPTNTPIPFEPAPSPASRRSVFANYGPGRPEPVEPPAFPAHPAAPGLETATLQEAIDRALARVFLSRFLAQSFADPDPEGWDWIHRTETRDALRSAARPLDSNPALAEAIAEVLRQLEDADADDFAAAYLTAFGHTVRGDCPMNEIEYGDIKADPLFQPHRLADLGAFYAAFGMELTPDAAERQDHISIELEFLSVLNAKEAYALEHQLDDEALTILCEGQRQFVKEHLARWTPAFTRRLAQTAGPGLLAALAGLTREFLLGECRRFGLQPGSEDLLLRPIDDAAERLCASCGIANLPPGAAPAPGDD